MGLDAERFPRWSATGKLHRWSFTKNGEGTLVDAGTSAERQIAIYEGARGHGADAAAALGAVVDWLAEGTRGKTPA